MPEPHFPAADTAHHAGSTGNSNDPALEQRIAELAQEVDAIALRRARDA